MADGAYRWLGNAPTPDPARVEALHASLDQTGGTPFGETARVAAIQRIDRALAATSSANPAGASATLASMRAALATLNPDALEPRRGLAGMFDSRAKRLDRFRRAYAEAVMALGDASDALAALVESAAGRSTTLDAVWTEIRDTVTELDTHLACLSRRPSDSAEAADAYSDRLESRRATLSAGREAALRTLALVRTVQNADARAAEALQRCIDAVAAWRTGWREALGLAGKRPKKVRPDKTGLVTMRDTLSALIERAEAESTSALARRAAIQRRMAAVRAEL